METTQEPQTPHTALQDNNGNNPDSTRENSSRQSFGSENAHVNAQRSPIFDKISALATPHLENGVNVAKLQERQYTIDSARTLAQDIIGPDTGRHVYLLEERLSVHDAAQNNQYSEAVNNFLRHQGDKAVKQLFRLNVYSARQALLEDYHKIHSLQTDDLGLMERQIATVATCAKAITDYEIFSEHAKKSNKSYKRELLGITTGDVVSWNKDVALTKVATAKLDLERLKNRVHNATVIGPPLEDLVPDEEERKEWKDVLDDKLHILASELQENEARCGEEVGKLADSIVPRPTNLLHQNLSEMEMELEIENRTQYFMNREQWRLDALKFFKKLGIAIFGGLSLVAPMLIMVLHPTLLTRLLTTSLFVTIVGILLTFLMSEAERKDLVGATAAYAAVLVVFVGTAGENGPSDTQFTTTGTLTGSTITGNISVNTTAVMPGSEMSNRVIAVIVVSSILGTLAALFVLWILWALLAYHITALPGPIPGLQKERKLPPSYT